MPPQRQRLRLTTEQYCPGSWACWNVGLHIKGCHHLWCEPKCDNQSMESLPDVCIAATQCHADGRQRTTMLRQGRSLVVQARRRPFANATTLRNEF